MHVSVVAHDAADGLLQFQLHGLVAVHADARGGDRDDENHLAVPLGVVCHVAYTVALDRVGYNHHGLVVHPSGLVQRVDYLFHLVAVDFKDLPVESRPLVLYRVEGHDIFGKTVLLNAVAIQNCNQVVELEFSCGHRSLPDLALI